MITRTMSFGGSTPDVRDPCRRRLGQWFSDQGLQRSRGGEEQQKTKEWGEEAGLDGAEELEDSLPW